MRFLLTVYFIVLFFSSFAQAPANLTGKELFAQKNYKDALKKFLADYAKDKNDVDLNYKIAFCYLNTEIDKKKAIPFIEFVTSQPKCDNESWYELGLAYQYDYRFDDAIKAYTKYKEKAHGKELEKVTRQIETCHNGKELIKNPIDVRFENLGKEVNSEYADYYPFIPSNEEYVVYTSRRKGPGARLEYDGLYSSDIYISEVKNGQWQKAKSAGTSINTVDDEECVGLTHDGHTMLIYIDHQAAYGDIYVSHKDHKKPFSLPVGFSENVNSLDLETSGSINTEENTIVFSSNRKGGQGGTDIYVSHLLPDGTWGPCQNLGPVINTKYDEDFPQLSDDGKELYFCSKGHYSMGGFDVFVSKYNETTHSWGAPKNIGYPINTTDDDMHYAVSSTGHEAYISALRPEGLGDLDIYRVILNSVEQRITAVIGQVFYSDTLHPASDEITITVIDKENGEPVSGDFKYNVEKKKFVCALPPGQYTLMLEAPGYQTLKQDFNLLDKVDFKTMVKKKFILYKPGESPKPAAPPAKTPPGKPPVKK